MGCPDTEDTELSWLSATGRATLNALEPERMSFSFRELSQQLTAAIQGCDRIRPPDANRVSESKEWVDRIGELRGRALLYPMMPTGKGSGPFIEFVDGSVKMDLITGIGVSLFGYNHPDLLFEAVKASFRVPVMQGTLMPGKSFVRACELLVKGARGELAGQSHLSEDAKASVTQVWLTSCGTMANELAMKIIRQKKSPAYKLISIKNSFAGRSSTMGELTDEPKYREGQPTFDQVKHVDFFDEDLGVEGSVQRTVSQINEILDAEPDKYCAFVFEPIQGEGGAFRQAPREWWVPVLEHVKSRGLAVWMDEVQTFGRTGELFAFQRFELGKYVDLLTVAKPMHVAAVLWKPEFAPKPGLLGGTFAASGSSLAIGVKIVELLCSGGYLGPQGSIQKMERFVLKDWNERKARIGEKFNFGKINIAGGMIAMEILDGNAETIKTLLMKMFDKGVIAFSAGKAPVCLRFLPPMGVLTESHWLDAMSIMEKALEEMPEEMRCVQGS